MTFSGADVNARPVTRPGEVLEGMPGLIVTQHTARAKPTSIFCAATISTMAPIRITLDDMPINSRTHAHGQGYSDLNFLIPELTAR